MNKTWLTIGASLAIGILILPAHSQSNSAMAREFLKAKDRWAVKTGADAAAKYLRVNVTQPTRVRKVIPIDRPIELPLKGSGTKLTQINRYSDTESKVFSIDADILRYSVDPDDHDIYLVLRDHDDLKAEEAPADSGERRTMIAKIPDPSLVVLSSPWRSAIARARRSFEQRFHPGAGFTERVIHARVTGVGFFDYLHGQNGVALNGLELHPVLSIEFIDDAPVGTVPPPSTELEPFKPTPAPTKFHKAPFKPAAPAPITTHGSPIKPEDSLPVLVHKAPVTPRVTPSLKMHKTPIVPHVPASPPPVTADSNQVWVNLGTGTYWRQGTRFYGKTKRGRYMNEDEAIKIGFIPAPAQR